MNYENLIFIIYQETLKEIAQQNRFEVSALRRNDSPSYKSYFMVGIVQLPIFRVYLTFLISFDITYYIHQPHVWENRSPSRSYFKPTRAREVAQSGSLVVLRNRITRRLRNDTKTEGRKVDRQVRRNKGIDGLSLRGKTAFIPLHVDIFNCFCLLPYSDAFTLKTHLRDNGT